MQVAPGHDIDGRQHDHGGLEGGSQKLGVGADVGGELTVEPSPKRREESHMMLRNSQDFRESAGSGLRNSPVLRSRARSVAAAGTILALASPGRAPEAWFARFAAC